MLHSQVDWRISCVFLLFMSHIFVDDGMFLVSLLTFIDRIQRMRGRSLHSCCVTCYPQFVLHRICSPFVRFVWLCSRNFQWWFNIFQLIVFETLLSCRFFHVFPSRNRVNTPIGPSIHGLPCRKPRDLCGQLRADPRNVVSSFNQTWGWHGDLLIWLWINTY